MLGLRNMTAIDGTGLGAIEELAEDLRKGRTLVVCGARWNSTSASAPLRRLRTEATASQLGRAAC